VFGAASAGNLARTTDSDEEKLMRSLSKRAAGFFIVILAIWGGLIPFVGPYFHFAMGPDKSWTWTSGRLWLDVLPGAVAILGGLMLLGAGPRLSGKLGALLALAAGIWFAIGPSMSLLWNSSGAQGAAHGSTGVRVLEMVTYHSALGAVMAALAGYALPGFVTRRAAVVGEPAVAEPAVAEPAVGEPAGGEPAAVGAGAAGAGAAAERDVAAAPQRSGVRNDEVAGAGAGTQREPVAAGGANGDGEAPTAVTDRPTTHAGATAADTRPATEESANAPAEDPAGATPEDPAGTMTEDRAGATTADPAGATTEDRATVDRVAPNATPGTMTADASNGERATVRRRRGGLLSALTRR
jgi:hypothetical protein